MKLRIFLCAALVLGVAPSVHGQRDTIRIGEPRDSAGVRLPPARPLDTTPWVPGPGDTLALADTIFDAPGTRELVNRVIRSGSTVPAALDDYRAGLRAAIYLSLGSDTAGGSELPVTVDEVAGELRWHESGALQQTISGHRVRLLAPTPYTIGSLLEAPWVIPHLYGNTITVFSLAATPSTRAPLAHAIHPFSFRGIDFYRYEAGDTVRVTTRDGRLRLVPVRVSPRGDALQRAGTNRVVAGTFYVDLDRAAIARARFGFVERSGRFVVTETGLFFELESALVGGQYWLPVRQRREIQIGSPLLGGSAAIRLVTALSDFELNTGWTPEAGGTRLVWRLQEDAFAGWRGIGDETDETDIADFEDLRALVRPPSRTEGVQAALRYENSGHLFRYNRVEGAFLGLGTMVTPRDPENRDWSVYAHAGYAFAEGATRGELSFRWHPGRGGESDGPRYGATVGAYRRLREMTSFRPPLQWEVGYALGAALGGVDVRDYYDAVGLEAFGTRRRGPWTARLGGRWETHDSVSVNTTAYAFGTAGEFPAVAPADPGTHAAAEATLRYARGTGAFGVGGGVIAQLTAEQGLGDFGVTRAQALLSARFPSRFVTVIGRADAGTLIGTSPTQFLYRFGGTEGLRGYERNEFGGTTAALGRARLLLHLPPYSSEPLFRAGVFLFPPLRPAIALSGDAGWAAVNDESAPALARVLARETDGWRTSYGAGLSFFEDAVSIEYVWPGDGGEGRWYTGFVAYF